MSPIMCARVVLCARLRRTQGSTGFLLSKKRKEGRREGGAFSKLSSLEAENSCDRKWIRGSLQVLFHEVCLFSRCCCLCYEASTLRSVLAPRKNLLWSSVTPRNSDGEGYGDLRVIAEARLVSARTQYRAQNPYAHFTKRDPHGCLLGDLRKCDFRVDPRPSIAH